VTVNRIARRGLCFLIAAPSGAGKSTITRALLARETGLSLSVSVTTRSPRAGEEEGVHYFFRSDAEFARMAEAGELLEHAIVFGRGYGTPRVPVEMALAAGRDVVFDIDWQGCRQVRAVLPMDTVSVFILPPSVAALEARLRGRAGDGPAEIARRMAQARAEMSHAPEFDHVLVNDDLETCIAAAQAVLVAARSATARLVGLGGVLETFG
jgi:guanylate kinase